MRRPSSARRDCQSKTRRRRRVARSACQRLGAQRLRRSRTGDNGGWDMGCMGHTRIFHTFSLPPPAQSREGGMRQGERWDACKRCTFFHQWCWARISCRRGFGRAGYKHVRTKKRRRVPIGSRGCWRAARLWEGCCSSPGLRAWRACPARPRIHCSSFPQQIS